MNTTNQQANPHSSVAGLAVVAALVAVFYLGQIINQNGQRLEGRVSAALAESAHWRAQSDALRAELEKQSAALQTALGNLPATAGAASNEAAKQGARSLLNEAKNAPITIAKQTGKDVGATVGKAVRDVTRFVRSPF